jgi:hypothetical protein
VYIVKLCSSSSSKRGRTSSEEPLLLLSLGPETSLVGGVDAGIQGRVEFMGVVALDDFAVRNGHSTP